jgi:hypothetical protein
MAGALLAGAAAGAAGTTALNAVTYLDMAIRGRPGSSTPQQAVETVADQAGVDIPGARGERENRLQGLGPLGGIAVGVGVGIAAGILHRVFGTARLRLPWLAESVLVGVGAMAVTDVPMKSLGLTDPAGWSASDWASDVVPHLAYGAVTAACLRAIDPRRR